MSRHQSFSLLIRRASLARASLPLFLLAAATPSAAQNLVQNGNFEQGVSSFYTGYILSGVDYGPGQFNVLAFPELWNWWGPFSPVRDHTPGNGPGPCDECFLVADGISSNVHVWNQTLNVKPNTAYRFRYWYASVYPWNTAVMQSWIRRVAPAPGPDTLIGQAWFSPDGAWHPVEYVWSSGAATQVTIHLEDVEGEEDGNDFGLDDFEFYECSPQITSPVSVTVPRYTTAVISIGATSPEPLSFQWQRELSPGAWSNLTNGPTGTGSTISGATTRTLTVAYASTFDHGNYRVIVSSCASVVSNPALLLTYMPRPWSAVRLIK